MARRRDALAARVLLVRDGKVLAAHHRHDERGDDFWCLPGGNAKPGERLEDAARRELREEAGLEVELDGVTWLQDLPELGVFVVVFAGRPAGPEPGVPALMAPVPGDRHLVGVAWRGVDELLAGDFRPASLLELLARGRLGMLPLPEA